MSGTRSWDSFFGKGRGMEDIALAVDYSPATITADFGAMRRKLDEFMEPYRDMDDAALDAMDAKELKACRADINRMVKSVEDGRKAVKKNYMEAYNAFDAQVRELLSSARDAEKRLKRALDAKNRIAEEQREQDLRTEYESIAPALAAHVPYERFADPAWTKSQAAANRAAKDEIPDRVKRIGDDMKALERMKPTMFDAESAELDFWRALDLQAACRADDERRAQADALSGMRSDMAEIEADREEAAEPEESRAREGRDEVRTWVFTVRMTERQKDAFVAYLKMNGIHGSLRG